MRTLEGLEVAPTSRIGANFAQTLYSTVLVREAQRVLEIGMAQGHSTLAILAAMVDGGGNARLTSIDPFQRSSYGGAGLAAVTDAGWGHLHRLIERPDFLALPALVADAEKFELIYIDGWHSFDHVLLDAFYSDQLLAPGGVMAFNDCGMSSVRRMLQFLLTHWTWYEELDVGLKRAYKSSNRAKALVRRCLRWQTQDRYFIKHRDGQVPWDFYRRF